MLILLLKHVGFFLDMTVSKALAWYGIKTESVSLKGFKAPHYTFLNVFWVIDINVFYLIGKSLTGYH